jgi:hypothetical protein
MTTEMKIMIINIVSMMLDMIINKRIYTKIMNVTVTVIMNMTAIMHMVIMMNHITLMNISMIMNIMMGMMDDVPVW